MGTGQAAERAYRALLWVLLLGSFACFTFITWARPTDWYRNSQVIKDISTDWTIPFPGNVPILTGVVLKNGKNTTTLLGRDSPLMSGGTLFPILLQWGSVMLAALCTAGLLPGWRRAATIPKASEPSSNPVACAYKRGCMMLRRAATYPLPPRHFWAWFCGGLTALELLFFATWLGLCVTYMYYNIDKSFKSIGANLTPPPAKAAAAPPSTSGATGVPAATALPAIFLSRRLNSAGKASGETLRVMCMVMFFPVSRSSFLKWLLGTDFSYLIKFHRWMSWGTIWVSTAHGILYLIQYGCAGTLTTEFYWEVDHRNVTGLMSTLGALAIAVTSCAWFRANYYRVFINTHIIGFIVFVLFGLMHYKALVNWIMAPLILYGMDRAFRLWQLSNWCRVSPCDLHVDDSVLTLRLMWAAASRVRPGQTVYLRVPGVSWLQSHPFSVSRTEGPEGNSCDGAPQACTTTVHIKVAGAWTRGLRRLALSGRPVLVQVEGPYDTSLDTPPQGPVVIMVAGGMGVTPLLGLLRHYLLHPLLRPRTAYLLWSSRALCELRLLGADLLAVTAQDDAKSNPKPLLHVTVSGKDAPTTVPTSPADDTLPGWLHAFLHYTGFEADPIGKTASFKDADTYAGQCGALETASSEEPAGSDSQNSPQALAIPQPILRPAPSRMPSDQLVAGSPADSLPTSTKTAAADPPRPLSVHPVAQPVLYAACVVLAMFGCFAGLITASYIDAYEGRITDLGMFYPTVGVVQFFLVAIGSVVPPLALLASLPALAWCARRLGLTRFNTTSTIQPGSASKVASQAQFGPYPGPTLDVAPGLRLVPTGPVDIYAKGAGGEAGKGGAAGLAVVRGRPDVVALLRRVKQAHMGACAEIEVLVGGPPPMWEAVVEACIQVGAEPGPALRPRRVAHQH